MKGPVKAEKRTDGFWYLVDKDGFCLAEIKGPPKEKHQEIALFLTNFEYRSCETCVEWKNIRGEGYQGTCQILNIDTSDDFFCKYYDEVYDEKSA